MVNKTLLGGTLVASFLCGGVSGYATRDIEGFRTPPPHSVDYVYGDQLASLRAAGYSDEELDEARTIYREYYEAYERWWTTFMDTHRGNFEQVDARLEERLTELQLRVDTRTGK